MVTTLKTLQKSALEEPVLEKASTIGKLKPSSSASTIEQPVLEEASTIEIEDEAVEETVEAEDPKAVDVEDQKAVEVEGPKAVEVEVSPLKGRVRCVVERQELQDALGVSGTIVKARVGTAVEVQFDLKGAAGMVPRSVHIELLEPLLKVEPRATQLATLVRKPRILKQDFLSVAGILDPAFDVLCTIPDWNFKLCLSR